MATLGPHDFSSPSMRFWLDYSITQSTSTNKSTVNFAMYCENGPGANSDSQYGGSGSQVGSIDGIGAVTTKSQTPFLPDINGGPGTDRWTVTGSKVITHAADGTHANITIRHKIDYGNVHGDYTVVVALPRIGTVPGKVTGLTLKSPTFTGMQAAWAAPSNGGSAITGYNLRYSAKSDMSGAVVKKLGTGLSYFIAGLDHNTMYYVQVQAINALGVGGWSSVVSLRTLPNIAPGLTLTSSASGTSTTVAFTPPAGSTGVYLYHWERRTPPSQVRDKLHQTPNAVEVVSGQTPGVLYEWRGQAEFAGNQFTPWTNWIPLKQAKPNTDPGDFFDGSTTDTEDLNYQWGTDGLGSPHASISTAVANNVLGWEVLMSSGAAVIYRVLAGIFSDYSAHIAVTVDATTDMNRMGQKGADGFWSEVTSGATFIGSIHCKLSRSQSVAAEITWYNSAGGVISRTVGAPTEVAGAVWSRLVAGGAAPDAAAWAAVRMVDVSGTGWSAWHGGDVIDLDGAMISLDEEFPYFDGSTLFDGDYVYEWTGKAHASTSTRTTLDEAADALVMMYDAPAVPVSLALVDPNCAVPPRPPRPPVIATPCIDDLGVWRRTFTAIPSTHVPEWMDVVTSVKIVTGAAPSRQIRLRYYANPDDLPANLVPTKTWLYEQIISYLPARTTLLIDGVSRHAWASINGATGIRADHLLYGTGGKPATWPVLSCGIGYMVTADVPTAEKPDNTKVTDLLLTART